MSSATPSKPTSKAPTKREQKAAYDAQVAAYIAAGEPADVAAIVARKVVYGGSYNDVIIEGEAVDEQSS